MARNIYEAVSGKVFTGGESCSTGKCGPRHGKAYLKRVDKSKPVAPQIAQMIVDSSLAMGESARVVEGDDEVRVIHDVCPWYDWYKKFDAVAEDQPGCDCWFKTIAANVNQELGTSIDVETVSSLPHGDERCERIFKEKD